jgi:hypothetical protein
MTKDVEQIEDCLQQFLEGKLGDDEARVLVEKAGLSADSQFAPLLKAIALFTSTERNRRITFDALHALSRLGESKDYFLQNARNHQQNKWLAYYSILILAREPNDTEAADALNEIKASSADNQIRGAIASAERVRFLVTEYARLETPEQKCTFLLSHFRGAWNPITLGESELDSAMDPLTSWSQRHLFKLSQENPEVVARAVSEIDLFNDFSDERLTQSYRIYVGRFIAPEASQRLGELVTKRAAD